MLWIKCGLNSRINHPLNLVRFIYPVFLWISMIIHSILKTLEVWTIDMYLKLDSAS